MRIVASLLLTAAFIGFAVPAQAADFSTVLGVDAELQIVKRVTDKTIFDDIRRVQSFDTTKITASGATVTVRETNESAVTASSDEMIRVCQDVQLLRKLSTEGCGQRLQGRTRKLPTPHKQ